MSSAQPEAKSELPRPGSTWEILKRASASRRSGEWNHDDYYVMEDSVVVGRIFKANADAPDVDPSVRGPRGIRLPTHGYTAPREDAMATLAKSWRRLWVVPQFEIQAPSGRRCKPAVYTAHDAGQIVDQTAPFARLTAHSLYPEQWPRRM
jgi:hypothetical protein